MKSLSSALERLSLNIHHAVEGRITPTTRPRVTARRATRERLGLECLETRDLMSGMTLATSFSNATPAFVPITPIILPPASLVATAASPTSINLVWSDQVSGAENAFVWEQNPSTLSSWSAVATLTGDPKAYTLTGLNPDSTYTFYVYISGQTYFNGSYVLDYTTSNVATVTTAPAAPVFSLSAASAVQVNVSWNTVAGATGYLVDEMVDGAWVEVGDRGATSDSLQVSGLSPNTTYEFSVAAVSPSGTTWATAQSVTTPFLHIRPVPGALLA